MIQSCEGEGRQDRQRCWYVAQQKYHYYLKSSHVLCPDLHHQTEHSQSSRFFSCGVSSSGIHRIAGQQHLLLPRLAHTIHHTTPIAR